MINEKPVSGSCSSKVGVPQQFKIRFVSSKDPTTIQKNSGNPGYLDGYPLKIGF